MLSVIERHFRPVAVWTVRVVAAGSLRLPFPYAPPSLPPAPSFPRRVADSPTQPQSSPDLGAARFPAPGRGPRGAGGAAGAREEPDDPPLPVARCAPPWR